MQRLVGGLRAERLDLPAEVRHGPATSARQHLAGARARRVGERHAPLRRGDEPVEELAVARRAQRPEQLDARVLPADAPGGRRPRRRRPVALGQERGPSLRSSSISTSVSRTAPSSAASHRSSSRRLATQSGSSSDRNVRRSERSRRVATRAWCTCSGSSPRRTPGSWATRRCDRAGDASLRTTSAAALSCVTGPGGRRRAARARGGRAPARSSASDRDRPAPAARSRATIRSARLVGALSTSSTSSSRNRGA